MEKLNTKSSIKKVAVISLISVFAITVVVLGFLLLRDNNENNTDAPIEILFESIVSGPYVDFASARTQVSVFEQRSALAVNSGEINTIGNTSGNIANGGVAAIQGEWIYFFDGNGLHRVKVDNSERQTLADGFTHIFSINVVGDWVYFSNEDGMFRISTDGSNTEKLSDSPMLTFQVVDEHIFYIDQEDIFVNSYLFRMRTDGTEKEQLYSGAVSSFNIVGNYIYCYNTRDRRFFRMSMDGSDVQAINIEDRFFTQFIIVDNWVYAQEICVESLTFRLVRFNTDNTVFEPLIEGFIGAFNVVDEWIYFSTFNCENFDDGVYRFNIDSAEIQQLTDDPGMGLSIVDDWIYFSSFLGLFDLTPEDLTLDVYRMRTDGSERERV